MSYRQFQKAEDHFSAAIQHNPQQAQYYLYRAKSRQLLQDVFGARQDLATALLLNPKLPKVRPAGRREGSRGSARPPDPCPWREWALVSALAPTPEEGTGPPGGRAGQRGSERPCPGPRSAEGGQALFGLAACPQLDSAGSRPCLLVSSPSWTKGFSPLKTTICGRCLACVPYLGAWLWLLHWLLAPSLGPVLAVVGM